MKKADTEYMKPATAGQVHNTKHREGMCACFQEKYYKVVFLGLLYAARYMYVRTPHN